MKIFRRRRQERRPHPDAAVEAVLQLIISMRRQVAGNERQIEHDRRMIRKLDRSARRSRNMTLPSFERADLSKTLRQEVRQLQEDNAELHDEIAVRIASLDPDDLLWL